MHINIYLENNLTNSIPIRFETTETWAFFEERCPNKKKSNKMSSDMESVPAKKIMI